MRDAPTASVARARADTREDDLVEIEEIVEIVEIEEIDDLVEIADDADHTVVRSLREVGPDEGGPSTERAPPCASALLRPVGSPAMPAYAVDPDSDEKQLQDDGAFPALLDLYRVRLSNAATRTARVSVLHKIASVLERLGRYVEAFDELVRAFEIDPTDESVADSLDRMGEATGRVGDLAARVRKGLHTAEPGVRVALLATLVFWYEHRLGRAGELGRFVSEIARLDKMHPIALRSAAQDAAAKGDVRAQRALLACALDGTWRREEKVQLHLALAGSHGRGPEAASHYDAALSIDPASHGALRGLERLGRELGNDAQVERSVERQVEVARTTSEKVEALFKLADLREAKSLRRENAAELLEQVLELDPASQRALKALARCYHALRDWPRLGRVLRVHAKVTKDKAARCELLARAGEVYEAKVCDGALAIEVYRDLLVADPTHRRALGDLARLYEKTGDWASAASFKARLAECAPDKRQGARELVTLADYLNTPDRDPIAAKLYYERAASLDPANAPAWEALQRLAVAHADDHGVVYCLEQRAEHVDRPRQRALVLLELAKHYERRGDALAARETYVRVVESDPTNEPASAVLLDAMTLEQRWSEAAPLCELLIKAAIRDKDAPTLFRRLRLRTRIASSLGNHERAVIAALAAIEARPSDPDAESDLLAVCEECRGAPDIVGRVKSWLARIADRTPALELRALVRLAELQRDGGELDAAEKTLQRARGNEADGGSEEISRALCEIHLLQHDYQRACRLLVDMAHNATKADARFRLLCEAGAISAKNAAAPKHAASVYEEARCIEPRDTNVLRALAELYRRIRAWDRLLGVLEVLIEVDESSESKADSLFAMATLARDTARDPARAADLFDKVLDVEHTKLEAFEELVRTLTASRDWSGLERAYRKMLGRLENDAAPTLTFALFHKLGLVYRDRLEDAARAFDAFDAAARIRPDEPEVRKIVTELLVVSDNLDAAVTRIRGHIGRDPHDPSLYEELYALFLRQREFDKAWCTVNVLADIGELAPEQRRFHEDYAPRPLAEVPGRLTEEAWASHIFDPDLDPTLTRIFTVMTRAVGRLAKAEGTPGHSSLPAPPLLRVFTMLDSPRHDALQGTFADAAEILCLSPPELLLGDPRAPTAMQPSLEVPGALRVSVPALDATGDSLAYLVGKRLAEQRSELAARALFPSVRELTALLGVAVDAGRNDGVKDAARSAVRSVHTVMSPEDHNDLRSLFRQAKSKGGFADVKGWSQAADRTSMRAALLVAGDVARARASILGEPVGDTDPPARERIGELYKFATSDLYTDLRGAIGVTVRA